MGIWRAYVLLYGVPQGRRTAAVAILSNSSRGTREVRGWGDDLLLMLVEKEKKNYAGSKTLPASIKEKETHWPEVP